MFTTIKMCIGFLFALGIAGFSIYKKNKGWLMTVIVALIGAIIFLGRFVASIGG